MALTFPSRPTDFRACLAASLFITTADAVCVTRWCNAGACGEGGANERRTNVPVADSPRTHRGDSRGTIRIPISCRAVSSVPAGATSAAAVRLLLLAAQHVPPLLTGHLCRFFLCQNAVADTAASLRDQMITPPPTPPWVDKEARPVCLLAW